MSDKPVTPHHQLSLQDQSTEFLLYSAPNGQVKVEVLLSNETLWLTQKRMAELFGVGVSAISKHLDNIYESGELEREATISILETVQHEGKRQVRRKLDYYNLDAVISVGYRVNSSQATQFRIWATALIKEYIIKGFAMDDERLKNGRYFGKDYFTELLERVRSIRASELIHAKADSSQPLMGMSTYKNAPHGRVLKSDTVIGKNYLSEKEIKQLERTVTGFFDYIEGIIERRNTLNMESFAESVNKFLAFNEYHILEGYGQVSRKQAEQKAFAEYEKFNKSQKIDSDFDRQLKKLLKQKRTEDPDPDLN